MYLPVQISNMSKILFMNVTERPGCDLHVPEVSCM
jgi:hypothetical protein